MDYKEKIILGIIEVINEKGIKFTMDDVAKHLEISKKTIYKVFKDKKELLLAAADYIFDKIKESEEAVLQNEELDTISKLKGVMAVLPDTYQSLNFNQLFQLREKQPEIYERVAERLETGWERTLSLIDKGIEEGVIKKDIHIPIFKIMMETTLEQFFMKDVLVKNNISYKEALEEVVEILINGIAV